MRSLDLACRIAPLQTYLNAHSVTTISFGTCTWTLHTSTQTLRSTWIQREASPKKKDKEDKEEKREKKKRGVLRLLVKRLLLANGVCAFLVSRGRGKRLLPGWTSGSETWGWGGMLSLSLKSLKSMHRCCLTARSLVSREGGIASLVIKCVNVHHGQRIIREALRDGCCFERLSLPFAGHHGHQKQEIVVIVEGFPSPGAFSSVRGGVLSLCFLSSPCPFLIDIE